MANTKETTEAKNRKTGPTDPANCHPYQATAKDSFFQRFKTTGAVHLDKSGGFITLDLTKTAKVKRGDTKKPFQLIELDSSQVKRLLAGELVKAECNLKSADAVAHWRISYDKTTKSLSVQPFENRTVTRKVADKTYVPVIGGNGLPVVDWQPMLNNYGPAKQDTVVLTAPLKIAD